MPLNFVGMVDTYASDENRVGLPTGKRILTN